MEIESFISLLGVDWKKEGGLFKIVCPFHQDTHPSLVVYPQDRGFFCYSCSEGGSWEYLYQKIKDCSWKEAYEILGIEGDYQLEEKKRAPRFEFVEKEKPEYIEAVREMYAKCLPLPDDPDHPAISFLSKKHILEPARELGWKWDKGIFRQSRNKTGGGAIVIPYYEDGELVTVRLRTWEDGAFSKPKTLCGTHARPFALVRPHQDLFVVEGESDALSLYASGCSVVAVPGAGQKRCINTAVLYGVLTEATEIISCGDNDGPGEKMNELVENATRGLTDLKFSILPKEAIGGLNDINDAYVQGRLNLPTKSPTEKIKQMFNATDLTGWDSVYAQAIFSTPSEIYELVSDELEKIEDEKEIDLAASLFTEDLSAMKKVWTAAPLPLQQKYLLLKDTLKLAVAKKAD